MGNVVIEMSMALDGYIAAPNDNPEQGLGEDGMRVHNWAFDDPSGSTQKSASSILHSPGPAIMRG